MANNNGAPYDLVLQSAAASATAGTAMGVGGLSGVGLEVTGTFSATITCQANADGTYLAIPVYNYQTQTWTLAGTITAAGLYWVALAGMDQFRANITAYTSGSVTVTAKGVAVAGPNPPALLTALSPAAAALADATANPTTTLLAALQERWNGATWDRARTPSVFKDVSAVTVTTIATVWTPAGGKKFRLMGGVLSASAAMNVLLEDNSAGAGNFVFRTPKLLVDTPFAFTLGGNGKLSAVADQVLKATGSAAGAITGTLYGTEE